MVERKEDIVLARLHDELEPLRHKRYTGYYQFADFSMACGIPRSVLHKIWSGSKMVKFTDVMRLCRYLGVEV